MQAVIDTIKVAAMKDAIIDRLRMELAEDGDFSAEDLWGWADTLQQIATMVKRLGESLENAREEACLRRGINCFGEPLTDEQVTRQREHLGHDWVRTVTCQCQSENEFCWSCYPAGPERLIDDLVKRVTEKQ